MAHRTHLPRTVLAVAAAWHGLAAADPLPAVVEIVATTPLQGLGAARERIPANVQTLTDTAVDAPDGGTLPDALNHRLGSVFVNEIQGNPFQPDVNYRGFTASPLLGTPQGLSVYVDGVRMNQPFGDVVSWDLIPRAAIASLVLMPGSNPLFGLNTLGGALAVRTKDGLHEPGTSVQAQAGSYGRAEIGFEHGGHDGRGLHWYVTGTAFYDGGWRDDSPTRLGQWFGKAGWRDGTSDVAVGAAFSSSRLGGNGLQEQRLLANPCKLPNAMAGDPPLRQVVTRTWEAGLRGANRGVHWNAGVFRTTNDDDILFVADNAAGFGYFRNFGRTRRQGVELGADSHAGAVALSAHYTYLAATFDSGERINSPGNSSADAAGTIAIGPGDRLPLMPRHVFKARAEWHVTSAWAAELGMAAVSDATARGNENGQHRPDGKTAGHAVFDLGTTYQATPRLRWFAQLDNLFDRRYATAAQLGVTGFTADGTFKVQAENATFYAPGAPRTIRFGMRCTFD